MTIYGTTPAFLDVRDWTNMAQGEEFEDRDVRNASKVCLLGQTLVKNLFDEGESPIGKEIRIRGVVLKVIGVLQPKGTNAFGTDQDDILLAPWTTIKDRVTGTKATGNQTAATTTDASTQANSLLNQLYPTAQPKLYPDVPVTQASGTPLPVRYTNVDQILVAARSANDMPAAISEVTALLRERHRLRPGKTDDFTIRDMADLTKAGR